MLLQKLKHITTFIFDVDGVLTDGSIQATESGELLRTFNIKDGYAMQLAVKKGYKICIISGGKGAAMQTRFANLGITDVFLETTDKVKVFREYLLQNHIEKHQVLYMGDDLPDLEVMKMVGVAACPADAVDQIKQISIYISSFKGGKTAARDVIEKALKAQKKWANTDISALEADK